MPERRQEGLPVKEKQLREAVDRYFDECMQEGIPPTPSGLALRLGVRTSALSSDSLTDIQKRVLDQAMQRIEASTMEMMLTKGGVKGMESVLERVEESEDEGRRQKEIRALTDEEIRSRLGRLLPGIQAMVEKDGMTKRQMEKEG